MRHRAGDDALPDTAFAQEVVFGRFCATIPFALHVLRDVVPLPEFRHLFLREFAGELADYQNGDVTIDTADGQTLTFAKKDISSVRIREDDLDGE